LGEVYVREKVVAAHVRLLAEPVIAWWMIFSTAGLSRIAAKMSSLRGAAVHDRLVIAGAANSESQRIDIIELDDGFEAASLPDRMSGPDSLRIYRRSNSPPQSRP
jgi:hypothetical protein